MRGRFAFALTALTLLFLLQGLAVLLVTSFSTVSDALYPRFQLIGLVPVLVPFLVLLTPSAPLSRFVDRRVLIGISAIVAAVARIPLSLPVHTLQFTLSAVVVTACAIFLSSAVGFLERRSVAGGVGAAIVLDQLLRLAGWSWDLSLRWWWVGPQFLISAAVIFIALTWMRMALPGPVEEETSLERRAGGLRRRGALALGLILFLDLNVLGRAEVASRWLGVRYEIAAVILIAAGSVATLIMLSGQGPSGRYRFVAVSMAAGTTLVILLARALPPWAALLLLAGAHGCALLLIGRALVPGSGRRKGSAVSAGFTLWLVANVLYSFTFYPSFTLGIMRGAMPLLFGVAGLLLVALLAVMPRPLGTPPPLRGKLYIALTLVGALSTAALLALRNTPERLNAAAGSSLRVATFNVHHGFDEEWRYDPARIVEAIRDAGVDVISLEEIGAGLPTAYGTDLTLYISRKLGFTGHFAATHNGLAGDAILTRVHAEGFTSTKLSPSRDPKQLSYIRVPVPGDTIHVFGTRLGLSLEVQSAQTSAILSAISNASPAVLLGDLNATEDSHVLAQLTTGTGFSDAFELAGMTPNPTMPSLQPLRRIDWILTRNLTVLKAEVAPHGGSDHRMVTATVRIR